MATIDNLTRRSEKGSPLTSTDHDTNLENLASAVDSKEDKLTTPAEDSILKVKTDGTRELASVADFQSTPVEAMTISNGGNVTFDFQNKPIRKTYKIEADGGFTINISNMLEGEVLFIDLLVCVPGVISIQFPEWNFIMNAGDSVSAKKQSFAFSGYKNLISESGTVITDYSFRLHHIVLRKIHYSRSFNIDSSHTPKVGQDIFSFSTTESNNIALNDQ